jgi:hypothetical protein
MATRRGVGLSEALCLVREGVVVVTRDNRFMLASFAGKAVPPTLRCEDMPSPGFRRVAGMGQ